MMINLYVPSQQLLCGSIQQLSGISLDPYQMYWKVYVKNFRLLKVVVMNNIFKGLFKRKNQKVEVDKTGAAPNIKCKECRMQFRNRDS